MNQEKGITLIELLIITVIIGVLAAIAIPGYSGYLQRARRADAKTALEHVRAAQEMWRAEHGVYSVLPAELQTTMGAPPTAISNYYNWQFTGTLTANTWTAQAVAVGSQASDGDLFINFLGNKTPANKWGK